MIGLVFRGATLLPGDADWLPRPNCDLLVRDGRVVAAAPGLAVPDGCEEVPAHHLLLLPAFINAHTHSPEALARGRAPMGRLDDWLAAQYAEGEDRLTDHRIRQAILLAAGEMVHGGAVQATDHFRQIPASVEAVAVAASAWAESGVRGRVAMMLRDLPSPGAPTPPDTEATLAAAHALLRRCPPGAEIGLGPSAPQRCSDALLRGVAELAREYGCFVHLHLCETALDAERCRARFGTHPVVALAAFGLSGPNVEYAHCVHLVDAELDLMAEAGTLFVHNPMANLRLGSGIAPVARAAARGVRIGIGTDGAGSNDTQDMLEAAKLALLLPRAARSDAEWPTPEAILRMATGGAGLRPGATADILAMNLGAPAFIHARPDEIAARLLLAARPRDITHVLGAGRFLMRDGALAP